MTSLCLGKLPAVRPHGLSELKVYATSKLPAPPASVEYGASLKYGMDDNDKIGDCVMAGCAHLIQAWNAEVKEKDAIPSDSAIETEYFKLTGGQDSGLNEASVLQTWHKSGLFGHKIEGYAPVDFKDITALHQTIAFYGGVMFGIACPESAQEQFGAGQPWTVVPGSPIEGGHCIVAIGYDAQYVHCVTWGAVVKVSYPFLSRYLDEAWCIISSEFVEAGKGPALDLASLKADLAALDH